MKRLAIVAGILGCLAGCGGGGGGGGAPVAPAISNFSYAPTAVYVNEGGGTTTLAGVFDFYDPDGDLASLTVKVYDSSDTLIDSLTDPFTDASGITGATIEIYGEVDTTVIDVFTVQIYVTDATGLQSNVIEVSFRVSAFPWVDKLPMPTPRTGFAAATLGGDIYIIGGEGYDDAGYDFDPLDTVEIYNPQTDNWRTGTAMPTVRKSPVAAVVNGKLYVIGGTNVINPAGLSTVEEYNPVTDSWITKTEMPTGRFAAAACVVDNKIYVVGGTSGGFSLDTFEMYDPALNSWASLEAMPTPREGLAAAAVNGKVYAMGGYGLPGHLATVEEYDPGLGTWSAKADMPLPRSDLSASVTGNGIFVAGGNYELSRAIAETSLYDPATNSWLPKTSMTSGLAEAASGIVDGKVYVFESLVSREYTPEDDIR